MQKNESWGGGIGKRWQAGSFDSGSFDVKKKPLKVVTIYYFLASYE